MAARQSGEPGRQETAVRAIDAVCNLRTPELIATRKHKWILYGQKFGRPDPILTVEELIQKMDAAGIERAFLTAAKMGSKYQGFTDSVPYEVVAGVVEQYPDRFRGVAGIDPLEGMEGVRALEHAVKEMGFIGAHVYPHWFGLEPDHRKYYPFYAKCVELDIPIQMQVGHCLIYIEDMPPFRSLGRPILLDTIACDFPELKLVGIHTGWPWVEEMISVAWKHPNVYIGSDAYSPRYWKPEFVHFINSWGQDKVIFGTDFPVIDIEQAIQEIDALELRPDSKRKLLRENSLRLYKLDG